VKVLVTGAAGFLGGYVLSALHAAGHSIRTLDRVHLDCAFGHESVVADLVSSKDLVSAFEGVDVLIHLAAALQGSFEGMRRNTVDATQNLLLAMSRSSTRRLVLASTFSVYDRSRIGAALSEKSPVYDERGLTFCDAYASSKTLQERAVREMSAKYGWDLIVLRSGVIWGPNRWGGFLLGTQFGPLQMVVAPSSIARLAYVENVADAFVRAIECSECVGEQVINVVDDPDTTIWHFARAIRPHLGVWLFPVPYGLGLVVAKAATFLTSSSSHLPYFLQVRRFEAMHKPVTFANLKLRQILHWTPRFTFEQAIARATARARGQ
jgi:2-alkyl-3-oxoalkanoate reductase